MAKLLSALSLSLWMLFYCTLGAEAAKKKDWWENEVFYQIYPRSFKDSDGDGVGDLKGVTQQLPYLAETGITATWLSPIFQSPMVDFGYDISDYKAIQPEYGTLEDFDEMITVANDLGIKIILDFVPNHSSDQHEWFKKSVARESGYENFYVWEDGRVENGTRVPPNNWRSEFSGSAWKWNEERGQYYLRQFTAAQPDLNYRDPAVIAAMDEVMIYWLDRGVAGFRIDAIIYVYEDEQLRDEPLSGITDDPNSYKYLDHIYTKNWPENYGLVQHWRKLLNDYSEKNPGVTRIMMTEGYSSVPILMEYYEDENGVLGSHFPFNFLFITDVDSTSDARDYVYTMQHWLTYMPYGHAANWVMGNHDRPRVGTRYGEKSIDALNMLLLTLPGIGITYYGEEIGMVDHSDISWEDTVDQPACDAGIDNYKSVSRDPERTPFQWNAEQNAGFSTASKTWLPVHPNYKELNLENQKAADRSHYKVYKSLLELRKRSVLRNGETVPQAFTRNVFGFKRQESGERTILTLINISGEEQSVDVSDFVEPKSALRVLVAGVDSSLTPRRSTVRPSEVKLSAHEGVVFEVRTRGKH